MLTCEDLKPPLPKPKDGQPPASPEDILLDLNLNLTIA